MHLVRKAAPLAAALLAAACDGSDSGPDTGDTGGSGSLEIVGVYAGSFGTEEVITEATFNGTPIRAFDNDENVLITQNPSDSEFNPDLFNRIVWTEPVDDVFYYCFVDFGLQTLQGALDSTATADASDPDNSGCGNFSWTRLRTATGLRGDYVNNFGGMETVTATVWQQSGPPMRLVDWSDEQRWVVTQNNPEADFGANLFNRIEYTERDSMDSLYYCFVDFGLATAEAARTSTQTADASDPAAGGCGMFTWTRLDPR